MYTFENVRLAARDALKILEETREQLLLLLNNSPEDVLQTTDAYMRKAINNLDKFLTLDPIGAPILRRFAAGEIVPESTPDEIKRAIAAELAAGLAKVRATEGTVSVPRPLFEGMTWGLQEIATMFGVDHLKLKGPDFVAAFGVLSHELKALREAKAEKEAKDAKDDHDRWLDYLNNSWACFTRGETLRQKTATDQVRVDPDVVATHIPVTQGLDVTEWVHTVGKQVGELTEAVALLKSQQGQILDLMKQAAVRSP